MMNTKILNAPGQLFLGSNSINAREQGARHFRSAADAVRFAIEQAAPVSLRGAMLQVGPHSMGPRQIEAAHRQLVHLGQARRPHHRAAAGR